MLLFSLINGNGPTTITLTVRPWYNSIESSANIQYPS